MGEIEHTKMNNPFDEVAAEAIETLKTMKVLA